MNRIGTTLAAAFLMIALGAGVARAAGGELRPYVLGWQGEAGLAQRLDTTRQALLGAGFEIAGEYAVSEAAHVFVVTNGALRQAAAGTPLGGYAAALRVSVTQVGATVQVAWTNPLWLGAVCRAEGPFADVAGTLEQALGKVQEFGSKDGISEKKLRSYHYMMSMPYFDDQVVLAKYGSHAEALEKVAAGLAGSAAVKQIARIDIPGAEETLFSVAILTGDGADATVLRTTDTGTLRHTAYVPYELLVTGAKAQMLHGKFRIAQSFPDLGMITFMKISGAPGDIEKVLKEAVR